MLVAPSARAQSSGWNGKSPREDSREQGRHGELCVARAHWGGSILCWGVAGYCSYDRMLGAHWAPAHRAGRPEEMAEVVGFSAGEGGAWIDGDRMGLSRVGVRGLHRASFGI